LEKNFCRFALLKQNKAMGGIVIGIVGDCADGVVFCSEMGCGIVGMGCFGFVITGSALNWGKL